MVSALGVRNALKKKVPSSSRIEDELGESAGVFSKADTIRSASTRAEE